MEQQILVGDRPVKQVTSKGDPLFQENFPPDW